MWQSQVEIEYYSDTSPVPGAEEERTNALPVN